MTWYQREITLPPKSRGFHLITRDIEQALPRLREFQVGLAHIFIRHTSASLALNENADPTVRQDMEAPLQPNGSPKRTLLPPHLRGARRHARPHQSRTPGQFALTVPISHGRFNLGTWQGIYLNEHRDRMPAAAP